MIKINNISKSFGDIAAVTDTSINIREGRILGLIGTNGAGKSTFLRMLSGIYKPDSGSILIDGEEVFDNVNVKKNIFYISDEEYFEKNETPKGLAEYYSKLYENFDMHEFFELMQDFNLDLKRKISTFSKGMKRQLSMIIGVCANTKYIFCDETFDGLDPVMRKAVKNLFTANILERQVCIVIASHNHRELEDVCDDVGVMYKGGILLADELDNLKLNLTKIQLVLPENLSITDIEKLGVNVMHSEMRGRLITITVKGDREESFMKINSLNPIFSEIIPLTLEEIFICETSAAGYNIGMI
ncbi:MAG: ABC transporter ATP-binding protein, partial [Lachnospiraceae bacterium]|nr:ABC transporter ATP-binding protein [Lachnospiraceae bacterium]